MNLTEFTNQYLKQIDETNIQFINTLNVSNTLKESILYSYTAGGKRIRPLMLLATIHSFNGDIHKGMNTAAALELIHTSSLIHDDLPSMDNDDYRRGKLTNHKVFGEATAILAGDALLINSYNLICNCRYLSDKEKVTLICELADCAGANGMIGGQQFDIENENKDLTIETLMHINLYKTGKLIQFALVAGGIISQQSESVIEKIKKIAYHIGIAFQIKDDILDVVGNTEDIGKPINSDEKNHKCTYVSLLGLDEAKKQLEQHYLQAKTNLKSLNIHSELLEEIFKLIIERNK